MKRIIAAAMAVVLLSSCVTKAEITMQDQVGQTQFIPLKADGTSAWPNQVLVDVVAPGSVAEKAGLRTGDIVLSIDNQSPFGSSHAMSILNNTISAYLEIERDGVISSVQIERRGLYGMSFKDSNPPPDKFWATGAETRLLVTNPWYEAFPYSVKPLATWNRPADETPGTGFKSLLAGISFSFALIFGIVGIVEVIEPNAIGNGSGPVFGPWALGFSAVSGLLLIDMFTQKSYMPFKNGVKVEDAKFLENSLYDSAWFNKVTGLNPYGITRDGIFPDGSKFTGRITDGKKQGAGVFFLPQQGIAIDGSWQNDRLEGDAKEYYAEQYTIKTIKQLASYRQGQAHGYALAFTAEGRAESIKLFDSGKELESLAYPGKPVQDLVPGMYYLGPVQQGLAHGTGIARTLDGRIQYTGNFSNGWLTQGSKLFADGGKMEGSFSQQHLVNGTLTRADGYSARGQFNNGSLIQGYIRIADGSAMEGRFVDGTLQSPGKIWNAAGDVYTGSFDQYQRPHGQGSLVYRNGDSYEGSFVAGLSEGQGVYRFKAGDIYTGSFRNGVFEGEGRLVRQNGESIDGSFRNNLPHGMAIYRMGNQPPERAEYYEGSRIDQAYLIRMQNEALRIQEEQRLEQARRAREAEQAAREAEEAAARSASAARSAPQTNSWATDLIGALQEVGREQEKSVQELKQQIQQDYDAAIRQSNESRSSSTSSYSGSTSAASTGTRSQPAAPAPTYQAPASGSFGTSGTSRSGDNSGQAALDSKEQRWNALVASFGTINFPVTLDPSRWSGNFNKHAVTIPLSIGARRGQFGSPASLRLEWDLDDSPNGPNGWIYIWIEQNKGTVFVGNQQYSVPGSGLDTAMIPSLANGQTVEISFDIFDATDRRLGRLSTRETLLGNRPSAGKLFGYVKDKLVESGQLSRDVNLQGPLKLGNVEVRGIAFTESQYNRFLQEYKRALMATW